MTILNLSYSEIASTRISKDLISRFAPISIIDLVGHGIGTLVIGKNDGWKQEVNMGKCTNQQFVSIPHARFIQMVQYKAELAGITVIITEESYTSRASFLDREVVVPLTKPEGEQWRQQASNQESAMKR